MNYDQTKAATGASRLAALASAAILAGCAGAPARPTPAPEVPRLGVEEAARALAEDRAVAVDVRPYTSYLRSRIKGARSLPYSDLLMRLDELPRNKLVVTYCA